MEPTFSSKHLEMEEQAFKAPSHGSHSDRASPLNPLQYDETFGRNGKLLIDMGGRKTHSVSSIVQMRNSLRYLATYYEGLTPGNPDPYTNNAGLVCFDSDGKVDTSFGTRGDGTVEVRFGTTHYSLLQQIIELENGQLLVGGRHRRFAEAEVDDFENMMMSRLESDGRLDKSFGNDGVLNLTALTEKTIWVVGTVVLPDGKIILAASIRGVAETRSLLIRLTANGQLDESFADRGILEFQRSAAKGTRLYGLKLNAMGTHLFTYGYYPVPAGYAVGFMARLNTNGNLDPGFGQDGFVDLEPDEVIHIQDVSISSDETHLLVSGSHLNRTLGIVESLLARRLTNGKADESFNQGKPVYLRCHPTSTGDAWNYARTLIDEAGKIVAFGRGGVGIDTWSVAGRFHATGKPDTSFTDGSSVGSPLNAVFSFNGNYVEGADPRTILCAGEAGSTGAVLAIKV